MAEISFSGGARIGWVNASWPFAVLTASRERVKLSSLGTYEFTPQQVVAIEPYGVIPLLASGLRINHNRSDYPKTIVFWCLGGRDRVIEQIRDSGFAPSGREKPRAPGFAVRWSFVAGAFLIWNGLWLMDRMLVSVHQRESGPFGLLALLLTFAASHAIRQSERLQRIVLSPGHAVGEIKPFLILLEIVSGLLSVVLATTYVPRVLAG